MYRNPGLNDYKAMQIRSARPEQLILMLYDGALRFLRLAIKGLDEKNIEESHNNLIRTQNILTELIASLNFDKGGEIANNLFRIYEYMHHSLVQANIRKEPEPARAIYDQLKKLRDSWAEAMKSGVDKNDTPAGDNGRKVKKPIGTYGMSAGKPVINKNIELKG